VAQAEATIQALETAADGLSGRQRGLWSDAFHRLTRNRLAMLGLLVIIAILVLTILGNYVPAVQRYDPRVQEFGSLEDPSSDHFFGTDNLRRDSWSRVLQGLWVSLRVGLGVQVIVLAIGLTVGGIAALGGRTMDNLMMRFTDLAYAFPDLLFIILMRAALQDNDWPILSDPVIQMIVAISFVGWVTVARLVRGQMLSLGQRDFVLAARAQGATSWRIVFTHMLPNCLGPVIVAVVFGIPLAIFAEAALGYIGLSVPQPTASLGRLVADGNRFVETQIWLVAIPAAFIALLMLCFTFLGDGLRDALDPRSR
jgi:oligopeptide transport system permease protein